MTERLAIACFVLVLAASFAAAQESSSGGAEFCATAPQELLVALDGSWSMTQGPGVAVGAFPIPLPAHPPVAMRLEYDAQGGVSTMSGQGEKMMMVPVVTEMASEVLGDEFFENFATATEGMVACDWYALPTLVGSNVYVLSGASPPDFATTYFDGTPGNFTAAILFCVDGRTPVFTVGASDYVVEYAQADEALDYSRFCSDKGARSTQGDMTMTITLKFDSPSSARGMILFSGESDGYSFAAWAPITMSR